MAGTTLDKHIGASIRMNIEPRIVGLSGRVDGMVAKAVRSSIEIILAIGVAVQQQKHSLGMQESHWLDLHLEKILFLLVR